MIWKNPDSFDTLRKMENDLEKSGQFQHHPENGKLSGKIWIVVNCPKYGKLSRKIWRVLKPSRKWEVIWKILILKKVSGKWEMI